MLLFLSAELDFLAGLTEPATKANAGSPVTENEDYQTTGITGTTYEFIPGSATESSVEIGQVTIHNDINPAPDERFGFGVSSVSDGFIIGDPNGECYENIVFVIQNDDGRM